MKKRIFSILLILMLVFCGTVSVFAEADFSIWDSGGQYPADVMGTQLLPSVKALMDRGIVTAYTDGLFHPERNISRAEFATMMARATNNVNDLQHMGNLEIFNDLEGYTWAKPYINAVTRAGLFNGRSETRFAPGENVTYAEAVTVLIRMNTRMSDVAESMAPRWPDNYILYAETFNILGPVDVRDWNAPATRGDVARLLHRFLPSTPPADMGKLVNNLTLLNRPVLTYSVGDKLDLRGLVVTLHYDDLTAEDVAFSNFNARGLSINLDNGTVVTVVDAAFLNATLNATHDGLTIIVTHDPSALEVIVGKLEVK
jgi:hypothetical protein